MCAPNNKNSDDDNELSLQIPLAVLQLHERLIFQFDYDSDNDSIPSLVSYDNNDREGAYASDSEQNTVVDTPG